MLRIYFLQHWFNLSDPAAEEAVYDSQAMRRFVGIDLGHEPVPDETTVCPFRHLLEEHDLGRRLFDEVQRHLAGKGLKVATGAIVDATIIKAPSSTKNADNARDPEMQDWNKPYACVLYHWDNWPNAASQMVEASVGRPRDWQRLTAGTTLRLEACLYNKASVNSRFHCSRRGEEQRRQGTAHQLSRA
jgi:IS5 family transposase